MKRVIIGIALVTFAICFLMALVFLPVGRWWHLQRLGQVPPGDVAGLDWRVASWTTWWGKAIDPAKFWKSRVIWLDDSATSAARRYGRARPPVPTHRPELIAGSPYGLYHRGKDHVPGPFACGLDGGPVLPLHSTDAEDGYWTWFGLTKPKPPETLDREQADLARRIFDGRRRLVVNGVDLHANAKERIEGEANLKRSAGLPPEAVADEALLWCYVMHKRKEYAKWQVVWGKRDPQSFIDDLQVDTKLISDDLTPDQVQSAQRWKIDYVERLVREKLDLSYIEAYTKAWNLSSKEGPSALTK